MPRDCGFVLPRGGIPQSHRVVIAPTCEGLSIRTERDTMDIPYMPCDCGFFLPRFSVPQLHRIVVTRACECTPIGAVGYTIDPVCMPHERGVVLPRSGIPQPNLSITPTCKRIPIGLNATLLTLYVCPVSKATS